MLDELVPVPVDHHDAGEDSHPDRQDAQGQSGRQTLAGAGWHPLSDRVETKGRHAGQREGHHQEKPVVPDQPPTDDEEFLLHRLERASRPCTPCPTAVARPASRW